MNKLLISCTAVCLLAIASCKKKEDDPNRHDLLTTGKWLQTGSTTYTTTSTGTLTEDNFLSAPACIKDDLSIFRTDNHLITDEGSLKCNPLDPQQTDEGIWSLTENDSKLIVTDGAIPFVFNINKLEGSALELEASDTSGVAPATTIERHVITFSHQD